MNVAIIITGTICSGKSTLSNKISETLKINLLNENNSKHFFGIIDNVKENKYISPVIIEHTNILNVFDENNEYNIGKYFNKKIIILLNVSDNILTKNINDRKLMGATGDYLNVDMFEMKKNIEKQFNEMPSDYEKYVANIDVENDYDIEYEKILDFLTIHLQNE